MKRKKAINENNSKNANAQYYNENENQDITNNNADYILPIDIINKLDKYIIGQTNAKRAIAIAIRNRYRRMKVSAELRKEIYPKNILMIGPTGVGKTEIARRMANILNAPFIKVEATKYTEIGYVGRNVESMIKDLVTEAVRLVRQKKEKELSNIAKKNAIYRVITTISKMYEEKYKTNKNRKILLRNKYDINDSLQLFELIKNCELDDELIELDATMPFNFEEIGVITSTGDIEEIQECFQNMFNKIRAPHHCKKRVILIKIALKKFEEEEFNKLINPEELYSEAISLAENTGIIFIDEIDKVTTTGGNSNSTPNVSREGVQRDILPIVEGTIVKTKYGNIKTDHILFIAAGAFHLSKPSDLIPELQGRFPIRVELEPLKKDDYFRILKDTQNSLIKQYTALLAVEDITLQFDDSAINKIAEYCDIINSKNDNIGARRLNAIMEKLVEDISFNCDKYKNQTIIIDAAFVSNIFKDIINDIDLSKYIL